jgi:hypothetical protein
MALQPHTVECIFGAVLAMVLLQRHPLHSVRNPTMGAANKIRRKN